MNKLYVVDTHALFWYLIESPRLSKVVYDIFEEAIAGRATLVLPSIVLLELYGLAKKVNAPFNFAKELEIFKQPPFRIESFDISDLVLLDQIDEIPELHDRVIAVTALRLNVPILTRDSIIQACEKVECIW